jgi:serine protease Do
VQVGRETHRPRRSWIVPLLLIASGIVIGVIVASELDWLPSSGAIPENGISSPVQPVASAVQPALPGSNGQNFVDIAKAVKPAVVNIFATRSGKGEGSLGQGSPFDDPFFRRFFGDEFYKRFEAPRERKERGLGSGVIVDATGVIITNNHVVNKADEIKVFLSDKREFKAKLVGTDAKTDIAVLRIEASGLPTVSWADSDKLEVGEFVLAVGNPFGLTQTVTLGIVSALGRSAGIAEYEDFIQTDAAINPGNSGGALVNVRGELVGINTAIYSQNGGNMGIGFAVPSNMAHSIMSQLVQHGKVVRGWLGVSIQELTPELATQFGVSKETKGVLVSDVMDDSPAKKAGFERGDLIVEYDGRPMDSPTHLRNAVAQTVVGKKVPIKFIREKKTKTAEVVIGEQPKNLSQAGLEEGESAAPTGLLSDLDVRELTDDLAGRYGLKSGERGVIIVRVKAGSPAEEVGVREGDLVLEVNRKPVTSLRTYERLASNLPKDQPVLLLLKRQGRAIYLTLRP